MGALLPLANFSFEPAPLPAADLGRRGREAWVSLSKLRIDDSYQRPIDAAGRKTIRGIIENFSWNKFAPLVVSPRDGGLYAVVDGQHRAVACALHGGIKEVPCHILSCTPEEEAAAFATINGIVTRMHPQYLFRARIAAGDKAAVAADEAAKAAGVKILAYPVASSQLKVGETLSGRTIELELARVGRAVLVAALELMTRTGGGNAGLLKGAIIEGICDVLSTHPKWTADQDECRRIVHRKTVKQLYSDALLRVAEKGGTIRAAFGALLSEAFHASLGDGGKSANPLEIAKAQALKNARKGKRPVAFQRDPSKPREALGAKAARVRSEALARTQEAHHLAQHRAPYAPAKPKVDERALIEAHLAKHGARKLDTGASGQVANMMDWVRINCGIEVTAHGPYGRRFYQVGRKKTDLAGFYRFVNEERRKRQLEPLSVVK